MASLFLPVINHEYLELAENIMGNVITETKYSVVSNKGACMVIDLVPAVNITIDYAYLIPYLCL